MLLRDLLKRKMVIFSSNVNVLKKCARSGGGNKFKTCFYSREYTNKNI